MKLSSLLNPALIRCGMPGIAKDAALAELARLITAVDPDVTEPDLLAALAEREKQGPFSMGKGIAFPHARTEKAKDFTIALATCPAGIDFRAPDGHKVRIIIMFAIPRKHSDLYLQTLASFLNFFSIESNVDRVLEAQNPSDVVRAMNDGPSIETRLHRPGGAP